MEEIKECNQVIVVARIVCRPRHFECYVLQAFFFCFLPCPFNRWSVIIKSYDLRIRVCFCHENCRYSMTASNICYLCTPSLKLVFNTFQRGNPACCYVCNVVRFEGPLCSFIEIMMMVTPSKTFSSSKSINDFLLVFVKSCHNLVEAWYVCRAIFIC